VVAPVVASGVAPVSASVFTSTSVFASVCKDTKFLGFSMQKNRDKTIILFWIENSGKN